MRVLLTSKVLLIIEIICHATLLITIRKLLFYVYFTVALIIAQGIRRQVLSVVNELHRQERNPNILVLGRSQMLNWPKNIRMDIHRKAAAFYLDTE